MKISPETLTYNKYYIERFEETFIKKTRDLFNFMIVTRETRETINDIKHPILLPLNISIITEKSCFNKKEKTSLCNKDDKDNKHKKDVDNKKSSTSDNDGKSKQIKSEFLKKHFRTDKDQ